MRRNYSILFVALVATLLGAAGCGTKYPSCKGDKDCKDKEYCVNQKCQQCRNVADCGSGEKCNAGRCEKATNKCARDADCPSGVPCVEGECGAKVASASSIQESTPDTSSSSPLSCELQAVYFDFNESGLSGDSNSQIDKNGECIKKNPGRSITLTGFADPRGTEEYNLALSERRAQTVRERLTRMGVDGQKLRVVPKGEIEAIGQDESGWAKDRRVEFKQ